MKTFQEFLMETTSPASMSDWEWWTSRPHNWWRLLSAEAQRAYFRLHKKSRLRLTPQQQHDLEAAQTEHDIVREKPTFQRLWAEWQIKRTAENHGIHLPDWLAKLMRIFVAALVAFSLTISDAIATDPNMYLRPPGQETVIPRKDLKDYEWLGYHLRPNQVDIGYRELWNYQNTKLPDYMINLLKQAKAHFAKQNLSTKQLRINYIQFVNEWVNESMAFANIPHGLRSPYQILTETLKNDKGKYVNWGDCKDFAIVKMRLLHELGVPSDDMVMIVGANEQKGKKEPEMHIIVGVRGWDETPDTYVFLDINAPMFKHEGYIQSPYDYSKDEVFVPMILIHNGGAWNLIYWKTPGFKLEKEPTPPQPKSSPGKPYIPSSPPKSQPKPIPGKTYTPSSPENIPTTRPAPRVR